MFFHTFDKTMEEVKHDLDTKKDIQVVDVRFLEEYQEGHIPSAILLPLMDIAKEAKNVLDIEKDIYVYCRSGQRSSKAKKMLQELGFKNIYNIGGIIHWKYEKEM